MKKILSLILALTLVMSLSVTAFADNEETRTVTVAYEKRADDIDRSPVIKTDINWQPMTFQYNDASHGTWDPATHTYSGRSYWTNQTGNLIQVINHSNIEIKATFTFDSRVDGVTGKFYQPVFNGDDVEVNEVTLGSAVDSQPGSAPSGAVYLMLDGPVNEGFFGTVGTVKLNIESTFEILGENN